MRGEPIRMDPSSCSRGGGDPAAGEAGILQQGRRGSCSRGGGIYSAIALPPSTSRALLEGLDASGGGWMLLEDVGSLAWLCVTVSNDVW